MSVHVFWDNSNIWIGLKNYCEETEQIPSTALRVYMKNVDDYVVRGRVAGTKIIAGSYPPECADLLAQAQQLGYDSQFFQRINDGSKMREQAVDMNLQLQMTLALLDGREREVMAVLTGDSSIDPDSKTGFIQIVERVLARDWTVEIYAVEGTLSERKYDVLKSRFGADLQIDYINKIYKSITYLVEGDFYFNNDPSTIIHVPERIVAVKTW